MLNKDELNKLIKRVRNKEIKLSDIDREIRDAYPEILMEAVKVDGDNIRYVSDEDPKYFQMALEAVKQDGFVLGEILMYKNAEEIENFHILALEAVKQNYKSLIKINEKQLYKFPNYHDIALAAVKQSCHAISYLGYKNVAKYTDVLIEAVKEEAFALTEIHPKMIMKHPEIAIEAIKSMKEGREYKDQETSDKLKDVIRSEILYEYEEVIYSGLKKLEQDIKKCEGETRKTKMIEYENIVEYLDQKGFLDEEEKPITRYCLHYTKEDISEISPRQGEIDKVLSETILLETEKELHGNKEQEEKIQGD